MQTIATLGPSVRLVVVQFLMRNDAVPAGIPRKPDSGMALPVPYIPGVRVLESTPKVDTFPLAAKVSQGGVYELVDAWKKPHETKWNMSFVRFVFCHKEHVKRDGLHPDFIAGVASLEEIFSGLASDNLWATQVDLNPYFDNGAPTKHKVLMIGCAGRTPNTEVYSGGRDEQNRGVGPKVRMSTLASGLNIKAGNVILASPEPKGVPAG